jgi:hypothetical protein
MELCFSFCFFVLFYLCFCFIDFVLPWMYFMMIFFIASQIEDNSSQVYLLTMSLTLSR